MLGYFQERFDASYFGILYSSFHLESLDLLSYFLSMFPYFLWFLLFVIFLDFVGAHFLVLSVFACSLNIALFL